MSFRQTSSHASVRASLSRVDTSVLRTKLVGNVASQIESFLCAVLSMGVFGELKPKTKTSFGLLIIGALNLITLEVVV